MVGRRLSIPNGVESARPAGRPPAENIKDYDVFYFDDSDTSEEGEEAIQAHANAVLADLGVAIEVSNQARVHVWYESYFGYPYEALRTACDGIDRFLIMATCVGIRPGEFYAPHGLSLMYNGVLTMNPLMPYRDLFDRKAESYGRRWPWLHIRSSNDLDPPPTAALPPKVKKSDRPASFSKPMVPSQHHRLRSRPDAKLVKHVRRVISDRLLTNAHLGGNFVVAMASGHQGQYLSFASGQPGEFRVGCRQLRTRQKRK